MPCHNAMHLCDTPTLARTQFHPMDSAKYGKIMNILHDRGLLRLDQVIEPKDAPLVSNGGDRINTGYNMGPSE